MRLGVKPSFLLLLWLGLMVANSFAQPVCGTDEYQQRRMRQKPEYARKNLEVEDRILAATLNQASRYLAGTVFSIPVVVHIMHLGEAVGNGSNISDAQIQLGIAHLNEAFRNVGNYAAGPYFTNAGIPSADVEISFCLASRAPNGNPTNGINRVATSLSNLFRDDPGSQMGTSQDDELKSLSYWDASQYLNIWIVNEVCLNTPDVGCNVAGYATLAGSHGQVDDGVVLEQAFWGTSEVNSKIAIHEVGHYLNLLHTFQSGCPNNDCLVDGDRVCDTPPDQYTNPVSCATSATINSCNTDADDGRSLNPFVTDVEDIYENYMDYGFQSCQNTFTPGQKKRMRIALTQERVSLLASLGCVPPNSPNPQLAFISSFSETTEQTITAIDCYGYADYQLGIRLLSPSTLETQVNISLDSSSLANLTSDAEIIGLPLTIPPNTTTTQYITLRVYDDDHLEGDEFATLNLEVISGDAVVATNLGTHTVNIYDNDAAPSGNAEIFFYEDFESTVNFSIYTDPSNQSASNWLVGNNGGMSGNRSLYYDPTATSGQPGYDPLFPANRMAVFTIDASAYYKLNLSFDYQIIGEVNRDFGSLLYSLDGVNFAPFPNAPTAFVAQPLSTSLTLSLDPQIFDEQIFYVGFRWQNDFNGLGSNPAWIIDELQVSGQQTKIETALLASGEAYLGPYEEVYFYETNSNRLLARIENLNGYDYGCTTIQIDRAGTGAQEFWSPNPQEYLAQKTFRVTPSNNTTAGNYRITFYYTQQEIAAWASATGQKLEDIQLIKADIDISAITPLNYQSYNIISSKASMLPFAGEVALTTEFNNTGFSGFGVGVLGNAVFPVEWAAFNARYISGSGSLLEWSTASEENTHFFAIERSFDGLVFERLSEIEAAGNSNQILNYEYIDPSPAEGLNYYRLKQVDLDGSYSYSDVVEVLVNFSAYNIQLYPNPFNDQLQLYTEGQGDVYFYLTNLTGQIIFEHKWYQDRSQHQTFFLEELPAGLYFWGVRHGEVVKGGKLLKNLE